MLRSFTLLLLSLLPLLPLSLSLPTGEHLGGTGSTNHSQLNIQQRDVNVGWQYGDWKIRGVNIGGWLVLEPFITPSLFQNTGNDNIVDEYTFCKLQNRGKAQAALRQHWDTWITESDFAAIAAAGLNHVRIPIGFWAYDVSGGEPYIQGAAAYLDRAIGWARNHGLKVMIDLHGAPGSQNGYDNSGRRGNALWATNSNNVLRTKNIIQSLSQKYSDSSYYQVVTALGLLNEPATYLNQQLLSTTRQYWYDAYGAARYPWASQGSGSKSGLVLVIHDGFQPLNTYNNYMSQPTYEDVMIDHHSYQIFDQPTNEWTWDQHIQGICQQSSTFDGSPLWLVNGEWTVASTDCALWLNGRGNGARYDGTLPGSSYVGDCSTKTGDGSSFSAEYKDFMQRFWDVQTQTYENHGQGWIYWTWKTENAAEWSYSAGMAGGWIPRDAWYHKYSIQQLCG
ncbi:glucan 1,3-beta-glucosidase [Tremella mesenterica]|uniref:glucan 1,3-beta-glucosidase n=1 Tax=Tremella mesenterica TaxID=5217 RepID=A0A4Q1BT86_TREME|nr:glucan 1,3-beta-glucosidase [Tremella mesenterica]